MAPHCKKANSVEIIKITKCAERLKLRLTIAEYKERRENGFVEGRRGEGAEKKAETGAGKERRNGEGNKSKVGPDPAPQRKAIGLTRQSVPCHSGGFHHYR